MPPHIPDTGRDGFTVQHIIRDGRVVDFTVSEVRKDDSQRVDPPLPNDPLAVSDFPHDKGDSMIDPLIQQARAVNDLGAYAQRLEANLAKRRALRDQPHKRGHMTRRGVA